MSLFIMFSLLVAPVIHAAEIGCANSDCLTLDISNQDSNSEKSQNSDKMAQNGHHCCSHISVRVDAQPAELVTMVITPSFFLFEDDTITSLVVGLPLKPPSHA